MIAREGHFPSEATTVVSSEAINPDPEVDEGSGDGQRLRDDNSLFANQASLRLSSHLASPEYPASPHNTPTPPCRILILATTPLSITSPRSRLRTPSALRRRTHSLRCGEACRHSHQTYQSHPHSCIEDLGEAAPLSQRAWRGRRHCLHTLSAPVLPIRAR